MLGQTFSRSAPLSCVPSGQARRALMPPQPGSPQPQQVRMNTARDAAGSSERASKKRPDGGKRLMQLSLRSAEQRLLADRGHDPPAFWFRLKANGNNGLGGMDVRRASG